MNIKIIDEKFDQDEFNKKAVHPLQSWQWGEARKKMGIEVLRIGEYNDVVTGCDLSLQNIYQITFHKIPYTNYKIGYLPRSNFPSKEVVDFLYDYCKKNQIIFIKFEPHAKTSVDNNLTIEQYNNIIKSPHPLFPNWTIVLDLTKSEEELLNNMKPKTRYNIRLAEKKGVYVKEESNEKGFEIFSKLYFETCKRQKYFGHNLNYHKTIWENLKEKAAHILIAYYENTPLAAYEIFIFNDVLYYPYGGSSLLHKNLMAPNLLMWETIKFGKKKGAKLFDMWGSLSPDYDINNPWSGFTRFKEGYGGDFTEFSGSYDLVSYPLLYNVYNFVYKLRNIYLNLKLFKKSDH